MSWFSNFNASDALGKLNEISSKVQEVSKEAASKVQSKLPLDDELVKKLTLRSDELQAVHDLIDAQETRKEAVRDYLASLLPWETKDEAREILVEECREAMQTMSKEGDTFTGPFPLPENVERMFTEDSELSEATEESQAAAKKKLEKMGTLPQLLDDFDLDAHVGLIEKLFKADKGLADSYAQLESAGKTERIFWKNYFFHCALIRYEKGLSVEEIWAVDGERKAESGESNEKSTEKVQDEESVELTFEPDENEAEIESILNEDDDITDTGNSSLAKSSGSDYEIVDKDDGDDDVGEDLDELDAEIAKELAEIDDL